MRLTRSQVFYLTFMNYSILNLQILPLMIRTSGKDLWISTLLSSVVGFFIAFLLWNLEKQNPQQTWFEMMQSRPGGRMFTGIVIPIVIVYLWLLCILTSVTLTQFISIGFLQETPFWVIATMFGLSVTYSLRKGMISLADLAGLLTFSTMITGTTMSLAISGRRHYGYFLPIGEHGIYPIIMGAALFVPIWTELFFLGFLPRDGTKKGSWIKTYVWIVAVNTLIFVGHSEGAISVFGLEQSKNLNFPMLSATKAISLGFIDRFDVYGLLLMLFGAFIRVALYYQQSLYLIRVLFPNQKVRVSPGLKATLSAIFLVAGTTWLFRSTAFFNGLLQPFVRISLSMFFLFIMVYLFIRFTRAKPQTRNRRLRGGVRH